MKHNMAMEGAAAAAQNNSFAGRPAAFAHPSSVGPAAAPVRAQREAAAKRKADVERLQRIHDEVRAHRIEDLPQINGRTIEVHRSGKIFVSGEDVYATHPGFYDDWRATHGHVKDPALAAEVLAIADRLGGGSERGCATLFASAVNVC